MGRAVGVVQLAGRVGRIIKTPRFLGMSKVRSSQTSAIVSKLMSRRVGDPLVVWHKHQRVDKANDGVVLGEDAYNIGAPLDLSV